MGLILLSTIFILSGPSYSVKIETLIETIKMSLIVMKKMKSFRLQSLWQQRQSVIEIQEKKKKNPKEKVSEKIVIY